MHKFRLSIIFVSVFIFLTTFAYSESTDKFSDVYEKIQSKYKRLDKAIRDILVVFEYTFPKKRGKVYRVISRKGNKYRIDNLNEYFAIDQSVMGDNKKAYVVDPKYGKHKLWGENEYNTRQESFFWREDITDRDSITGIEIIDDRHCYVIKCAVRKPVKIQSSFLNVPYTLWLDTSTLVSLKTEYELKGVKYKNKTFAFRKILAGDEILELPNKVDSYENNNISVITTIKLLCVNNGINNSMFNPNKTTHIIYEKGYPRDEYIEEIIRKIDTISLEVPD